MIEVVCVLATKRATTFYNCPRALHTCLKNCDLGSEHWEGGDGHYTIEIFKSSKVTQNSVFKVSWNEEHNKRYMKLFF